MTVIAAIGGIVLILAILWEGFESIILPRRVTRRFRLIRYLTWPLWPVWKASGRILARGGSREAWLSFYGPLSLLLILGVWAGILVFGFALLYWANAWAGHGMGRIDAFLSELYFSGTTFFTLGLGNVVPRDWLARLLAVIEVGMGFGFLALVISYLPPLNQSFARREVSISLLDARAGSPPTAGEMLRRYSYPGGMEALRLLLTEWERWSAEILESHQSYPVLAFFRSQHEHQSWLGALAAVLDTCALAMVNLEGPGARQAELTFAMARHTAVDLCLVFRRAPKPPAQDRLPPETLARLRAALTDAGLKVQVGEQVDGRLAELRGLYEPYVNALATLFDMAVPPWLAEKAQADDWQVSEWEEGR